MLIKLFLLSSFLLLSSCDEDPSSSSDDLMQKLYVCDQGSDRVVVLDASTDELTQIRTIDINFSDMSMDEMGMDIPHFVAIDESNEFWFVTAFQSGYVGMFDLNEDTLISKIDLGSGSTPALLAIDEGNKMLYVSQMMDMGMMSGGDNRLYSIDYSSGQLVDAGGIDLTLSGNILSFPQPHAISIDFNTNRGTSLVTASHSADWLSMTRLDNASITPSAYPFLKGEDFTDLNGNGIYDLGEDFIDTDMDGVYDPAQEAVIEIDNGFKPLDASQKDNFIFISCLGNTTSNISGQVQSWSLNSFGVLSTFEYGISTKPWHIVSSPTLNEVFVVLSGSEEVDAGLSCLTYNEQGLLTEKWRTTDPSFDTLHGLTISSDGSRAYVSSRGDGSIYVFDTLTGSLISTAENVGMMMDGMSMNMGSLSGIAITQ